MFKPTYLYVKTHNQTGLKYFGKTTRKNPYNYLGSGTHWTRHLNKYGADITTEIIGYYTDKEQCMKDAINFSEKNNIVESIEWANLRAETLDGGDTSQTEGYKRYQPIIREMRKKCKWWNNSVNQVFCETPPDESYVRGRLSFNNVGAKLGANVQKQKLWVNNGTNEQMLYKDAVIPEGYTKGRLTCKAFNGYDRSRIKGAQWWNNGNICKMSARQPGKEWVLGRLASDNYQKKQKIYYKNPKYCLICNNPIPYDKKHQKVCSLECNSKNRSLIAKKPRNRKSKLQYIST